MKAVKTMDEETGRTMKEKIQEWIFLTILLSIAGGILFFCIQSAIWETEMDSKYNCQWGKASYCTDNSGNVVWRMGEKK